MHNSTCLYPLVASLTLGAAIFLATAGSEANAQELDWATSAGSGIFDSGLGIATDPRGNSYVTGIIRGSPFGVGVADVFVAKYARDGSLVWNTSSAGTSRELGKGIAADARGNSYVTGEFEETATFGAGEANETVLTSTGGFDLFVAKYAPDGSLLWATSAGGADTQQGSGIATDRRGNSYVTGGFQSATTFGAGEANETVLNAVGGTDLFVAKYARDGTLVWVSSASGPDLVQGDGIATDPRGNSYVTGSFREMATFGAREPKETPAPYS